MKTYAAYQAMVEEALPRQLASLGSIPEPLHQAMAYSLEAGGKRLRPVLLLAACDMAGGSLEEAMPFACALEMIHTYSLIHDDLPAMDNDDLRRGRPTNHKVFGEAMAILAGDGLLSAAGELMLSAAVRMDDQRGVRAAEAILRRAGVTGMVAGQTMDVTGEGSEPTIEKVSYIHLHKTADLLTAPIEAGLLLAGASGEQVRAGTEFGQRLGLAFQMVDDVLDVQGDMAVLGKTTGKDAEQGKLTWVSVRELDGAREDARAQVALAVKALNQLDMDTNFLKTLAQSTLERVQ
ncbi:MAG: polyprenyl synthetase family protein [Christensenellaceae bacterium]|nr:polyprenyl synthetase family protein [Christensenellaceae bacterium]